LFRALLRLTTTLLKETTTFLFVIAGNEMGVFCKKVYVSPQNETKLRLDLFFILHFTYLGGGAHPTHFPAYGLV